jgi:two-component system, NarL family, response regulator LiaR
LLAGAVGFIAKASPDIDIAKAVRETFQGMTTLNADLLRQLIEKSQPEKKKTTYKEILTARELEIAKMIADGKDNQTISETIFLANSTVRSHVNHILGKLNLKSRSDLVRFVLTGGLDQTVAD